MLERYATVHRHISEKRNSQTPQLKQLIWNNSPLILLFSTLPLNLSNTQINLNPSVLVHTKYLNISQMLHTELTAQNGSTFHTPSNLLCFHMSVNIILLPHLLTILILTPTKTISLIHLKKIRKNLLNFLPQIFSIKTNAQHQTNLQHSYLAKPL